MKELIQFSISRRFFNKANLAFTGLLLMVSIIAFNLDRIMMIIQPNFNDPIYISTSNEQINSYLVESKLDIRIIEDADIKLTIEDNNYLISSKYALSPYDTNLIIELLDGFHYKRVMDQSVVKSISSLTPNIEFELENKVETNNNTAFAFMLVTAIYFMMISFSSMSANEIVYEKTTKLLEIILTSIPPSEHFYGKMISGWLNIIIQTLTSGLVVAVVFIFRFLDDRGKPLCLALQKLGLVDSNFNSFSDVKQFINFDLDFIAQMMAISIILMIGIVSVQVIMVSVSSFVSNIEESSNIQSPMYIIFMGLYYFSLSFSSPAQLDSAMGVICSHLPITSMLFMPYRMMLTDINSLEILLCIAVNLGFLATALLIGINLYKKGIIYQDSGKKKFGLPKLDFNTKRVKIKQWYEK